MVRHARALRRWRNGTGALVLMMIAAMGALPGCEVDSFFDPSRTGRFEYEPTTIPVLERIDVIEPQEEYFAKATPPTPEDLMPRELEYYIYPGDVVTTAIFELTQANLWTTSTRRVDTAGYYRVPELGDVRAAGLTAQQFEDEIRRRLAESVMANPQVDVVVEQGGGLRFTVYGFVLRVGQYTLDNPNLRLLDALANAGGVPTTTERVYVIRQVVLSSEVQPIFEQERQPPVRGEQPSTQPTTPAPDIEDLIRQLETQPDQQRNDVRPGMLQEEPTTQPMVDIDQLEPAPQTEPSQPADQPAPPADQPVMPADEPEPPMSPQPPATSDQLEPARAPQQPPVDVDVVRPQTRPQDETGESFIYIPERGEWVRVPAGPGAQPTAPQPTAPAEPAQVLDRIIEIDYQRLSRGDSSQNIVIRPNDRIFVDGPPQGFVYIDGEVNRVGVYGLPSSGHLTLSRIVTAAGGFGPIAIPERVDLTRKIGPNREATIRLDLAAIRQRTEPDVMLKPDDHIIVGTSWVATPLAIIRNGFRATYGFGFLLDRNFGPDVFGEQQFAF